MPKKVYSHSKGKFISNYPFSRPDERWEFIPNTDYLVSNHGRAARQVKRIRYKTVPKVRKPFTRRIGTEWRKKTKTYRLAKTSYKIIRPTEIGGGKQLRLWKHQQRYGSVYMQNIVADLFQLRKPGEKVIFRDGDIWNPSLSNLSVKDNRQKISKRQREFCFEMFNKYPARLMITELATRFMVHYFTINKIYKEYKEWSTNQSC